MIYWCKKCKTPIFDKGLHNCSCDGKIIKIPDSLSDDQKKHKVHNLLTTLKNKNIIEKDGENQRKANWILKD